MRCLEERGRIGGQSRIAGLETVRTPGIASWALRAAFGLLALTIITIAAHVALGIGGAGLSAAITGPINAFALVLVSVILVGRALYGGANRRAWALLALGTSSYALSSLLWWLWLEHVKGLGTPSICDVLWLAFYPLSYAAILDVARDDARRRVPAGVWLDGIVAGMAVAAIGATFVLPPIRASAHGSAAAVTTALAYPVGDIVLAALVIGLLGLRRWRMDGPFAFLSASLLCLAISDGAWNLQVASGSYTVNGIDTLGYVLAFSLLAGAAWQRPQTSTVTRAAHWSSLLLPTGSTAAALVLLSADHFRRVPLSAFILAMLTLVLVTLRMALTLRDMLTLADARRQAVTDDLTQLPNRRLFSSRLRDAIVRAPATGQELTVMVLDLDNFKQLNDTLGHAAGDELLRLIGPRLRRALSDTDTVARLGGDEFAILLDREADPTAVAERLLTALRQPFQVQGLALRLTASIGVASFPRDADGPEELMKCADVAMYLAKLAPRGWELYSSERDTNTRERLLLAGELAEALENGEVEAHFQPIALTSSGRVVGSEALVRWRREGALLAPDQFLDAAQHAGLSRPLTRRMLSLALGQAAAWRAAGHDLYVSVNTTVSDLLDMSFPDEVESALIAAGIPARALVLEVTESSIMSDPQRIGAVLGRLRELGVEIALDDFGTGYSSLAHLRTLSVTQVKLDRSFVSQMCDDQADAAIVSATIGLAHALGITVVAEGVENERTWDALRELGCERLQGFALGRPVIPAAFPLPVSRAPNSDLPRSPMRL